MTSYQRKRKGSVYVKIERRRRDKRVR